MDKLTIAIAGLGSRGRDTYARYIIEKQLTVTAAADPDPARLQEAAAALGIPEENCVPTAAELLAREKTADILLICTPDENHFETAVRAIRKGYHLLLEKPIALTEADCLEIARVAEEHRRIVVVCHVLRYAPFYNRIKDIIDSGKIGTVVTVNAVENVGYYHQAHSYVRGKWRDTRKSSPMILAKCCHDIDILLWLIGRHIEKVSSFGRLSYFKPENAPDGATKYCLGGCREKAACPYDAEKIYLTDKKTGAAHGHITWPADVLARPVTAANIRQALENGPYGRCVFFCDNDAVDHQVVNLEFTGGVTAHLTMTAFSPEIYRTIQVMGTLGMIEGDMRSNTVTTSVFGQEPELITVSADSDYDGHGGGDGRMFDLLVALVKESKDNAHTGAGHPAMTAPSVIADSLESHLACFAAERSRLGGGAVETLAFPATTKPD